MTGAIAFGAAQTALSLEQGSHEVERDALRTQGNVSAPGARFELDRLGTCGIQSEGGVGPGLL